MRKRKGIALITVLIVSSVLLAIVGVGLGLGSSGVLFASQAHKRNVALSAAEAGVYQAMAELELDRTHSGSHNGQLNESNAAYNYTLVNDLQASSSAIVISTGEFGGVKRTLRVELEPDSAGFNAINVAGEVFIFDRAYVNGIVNTLNPDPRPGGVHSNFGPFSATSVIGVNFENDGDGPARFVVSGELSAAGQVGGDLIPITRQEREGVTVPAFTLNDAAMRPSSYSSTFTRGADLGGTLTGDTQLNLTGVANNNLDQRTVTSHVVVPKGVTLHVRGDVRFFGGLSGDGQVVVDGNALIIADNNFDPNLEEGLKVHVEDAVMVTHPRAEYSITEEDISIPVDPVGEFFASMPMGASEDIAHDMPTAAPQGADFFVWYANQTASTGSAEYNLWYNGDGTDIHPGLSAATKNWLNQLNTGLAAQIVSWANS